VAGFGYGTIPQRLRRHTRGKGSETSGHLLRDCWPSGHPRVGVFDGVRAGGAKVDGKRPAADTGGGGAWLALLDRERTLSRCLRLLTKVRLGRSRLGCPLFLFAPHANGQRQSNPMARYLAEGSEVGQHQRSGIGIGDDHLRDPVDEERQ
jgi:hypothetical protein